MTLFSTALNPILKPLLSLGPFLTILIISLVITFITTIIYKYATDQDKLKHLKSEMKRYQKKALAAKDDPDKAMKYQKQMMSLNGDYMRSSMRSMLFTFLPILFFFGWLGANLAFAPLMPGVPFTVEANFQSNISGFAELSLPAELSTTDNLSKEVSPSVVWSGISGPAGTYDISIKHIDGEEQFVQVLVTEKQSYLGPDFAIDSDVFKSIIVGNEKLKVFKTVPFLNTLPVFKSLSWFWTYFLLSIIFSTTLRKLMKLS